MDSRTLSPGSYYGVNCKVCLQAPCFTGLLVPRVVVQPPTLVHFCCTSYQWQGSWRGWHSKETGEVGDLGHTGTGLVS